MRRFTDPILLFALLALDAIAWLLLSATSGIPVTDPGRIAPMAVGTVVVIAAPALTCATVIATMRAIMNRPPRSFYAWASGTSVLAAVVTFGAGRITAAQDLEVGFTFFAWYFAVSALAFLIALVIALTGAIPTPSRALSGPVAKAGPEGHSLDEGPLGAGDTGTPSGTPPAVEAGAGTGAAAWIATDDPVPDDPAAPDAAGTSALDELPTLRADHAGTAPSVPDADDAGTAR